VNVLVEVVALLLHEVDVGTFARPTVDILDRQHAHVDLVERDRPQNLIYSTRHMAAQSHNAVQKRAKTYKHES